MFMKWAILLGSPDISGGTYVIFEHAIRAVKRGVDIEIVTEDKFSEKRLNWHPEAKLLNWKTFDTASNDYDIAIATWWRTIYELHRISAKKYAYFVQSIESKFYNEFEKPLRKLVDATYVLPFEIITEAKWIQKYLSEEYGKSPYLVRNGVRKDIYTEHGKAYDSRVKGRLRLLIEGPVDVPFKNVMKTIELCKRSEADEIWLLTSSPIKNIEGVDRVFSRIPIFETPKVYRSCDAVVKLSYVEGMFGPPLEMFHCGGTAITYDVTGYDEYLLNEVNSIVIPTDQEELVIDSINRLKNQSDFLEKLKKNAKKTAKEWPGWEACSKKFENAIESISKKWSIDQNQLRKKSNFFFDYYVMAENYKLECDKKTKLKQINFFHKIKNFVSNRFPNFYNKLKKWKLKLKYMK